jgi:hypothetical protein
MDTSIKSLLDPNLGLSGFIDQAGETGKLPQPRPLSTGAAPETGLADMFKPANFQSLVLAGLAPRVGDESLLRPDILRRNLAAGLERLKKSKRPEVRRFVRDDLGPLLEDQELLQSYVSLMMSG